MAKVTDPIKIGTMELKNRLVGAPLLTATGWEEGAIPSQAVIDLYRERAEGGLALVQVEAINIFYSGPAERRAIVTDEQVKGLAKIADAIHQGGAKVTVQLYQGGRQHPNVDALLSGKGDWRPVAPSDQTPPYHGWPPRGLSSEEVEQYLDQYASAALKAKQAGFDGALFHAAHGFLPMQFLSPYTNVGRNDKYGKDRVLFAEEMVRRSRAKVGPEFPLLIRISGHEGMGDRGLTPTLIAKEIAPRLVEAGIDAIDVSGGNFETFYWVGPPLYFRRGLMIPWAEEIQKAVKVPVIGVGRINDPRLVEKILRQERIPLVALGRAIMADPDFPKKMIEERWDEICQCIACDGCPWTGAPEGAALGCAINPFLGLPAQRAKAQARAEKLKKVVVIGGGVAGMEAADIVASRGHDVTLLEKSNKLGGLVNLAAAIPRVYTRELGLIVRDLRKRMKASGVKVELGKEATAKTVQDLKPDVAIVATGSMPQIPDIPGADKPHVVTQEDYIDKGLKLGERVVVLGAALGAEVALGLARQGKQVVLLDERPEEDAALLIAHAPYFHMEWRSQVLMRMLHEEPNLRVRTGVKIKAITDKGVLFYYHNLAWEELIEADNVILALGREPRRELAEALKGSDVEVREIGDCVKPRTIWSAIHDGAAAALDI